MRLLKNGPLWMLSVACAVAAAACTSAGGATQQDSQARTATLFEGARVIVGDGTTTIENAAFLVQGNRITSIGRSGEIQPPSGATRVNLTGKTVMPALLDLHSHIGYEDTATNSEDEDNFTRENVIDHLERFAYTGHALTHSLGNDNPALFDARYAEDPAKFVDLRVESQQDSFTGARYYTIGRGLAWEGTGNPRSSTPYPIFKPLQARLAVRELHAQGISFAKLWLEDRGGYQIPGQKGPFYLTQESYSAAITEAHRLGMRTIAHVKTLADTKAMIRAGLDIQTHPIQDFPVDAELIALMKGRPDFWVIPVLTPAGLGGSAPRAPGERPAWLRDPLLRAVKCEADLERWGQTFEKNRRVPTSTGNLTGENITALYKAGVHMALGSHDAGWHQAIGVGKPHGAGGVRELGRHDPSPGDRLCDERRGHAPGGRRQSRDAGARQGCGLHRARRQSAGRHQEYAQDFGCVPARKEDQPRGDGRQVEGRLWREHSLRQRSRRTRGRHLGPGRHRATETLRLLRHRRCGEHGSTRSNGATEATARECGKRNHHAGHAGLRLAPDRARPCAGAP